MATDLRNGEPMDGQGQSNRIQTSGMVGSLGGADGMVDRIAEPADGGDATNAGTRPRISEPSQEPSEQVVAELLRLQAQELARDRHAPVGRIGVNEVDRYVGSKVTAVGTDGIEHTGKLESADANVLWIETYFSGGTFAVELKKSQIRSLEILGD